MKPKSEHPCPNCQNDDDSMIEQLYVLKDKIIAGRTITSYRCDVCSKTFIVESK